MGNGKKREKRAAWVAAATTAWISAAFGQVAVQTGTVTATNDGDFGPSNTPLAFGNAQLGLAGGVTVEPGGTLTGRDVLLSGNLTAKLNDSAWLFTGPISGTGSLNKQGTGVLLLYAQNSYSGGTTIEQSVLYALTNTALGTGSVTVNTGGTLGIYQPPYATTGYTLGTAPISLANPITLAGAGSELRLQEGGTVLSGALFNYRTNTTLTGTLTLVGPAQITNDGNLTVNGPVDGRGGALTVQGGYQTATVFNGAIGPNVTGGLTLIGDSSHQNGALFVLSGDNTYTGGTALIGNALLRITRDGNLGNASGALSLNGATLDLASNVVSARPIVLGQNSGLIQFDANTISSFSGPVTGSGALILQGAGEIDLSGTSSFSGGTVFSGGTLGIRSNTALGTGTAQISGTLVLDPTTGDLLIGNQMAWNTSQIINRQGDNRLTGAVVTDGATINAQNGSLEIAGGVTGTSLSVMGSGTTTVSGRVTITDGIVQNGPGALILTHSNDYAGGTSITGGELVAQQSQALGTGRVSVFTGGALVLESSAPTSYGNLLEIAGSGSNQSGALENRSGSAQLGGNIVTLGDARINSNDPAGRLTIAGNIAGATEGLTRLTFGGAGNTTVNGIILDAPTPQTAGSSGWGSVAGGGTTVVGCDDCYVNSGVNGEIAFPLPPLPVALADSANSLAAVLARGSTLSSVGTSWIPTYSPSTPSLPGLTSAPTAAAVRLADLPVDLGAGSLTLVKDGSGTLTLSGVNLYSGGTTILGGTLAISNDANLGASGGGVTLAGGTLELSGNVTSARPIKLVDPAPGVDESGNLPLNTISADAQTVSTLTGSISGGSGLTKAGGGTLVLAGGTSQIGPIAVAEGTLLAGSQSAFPANSSYTVAHGATLDLNGFPQTFGSLTGEGQVKLGSGTLTIGSTLSQAVFFGVISGSGSVVKTGTGTLLLSGANSFSGGTTIQGGVLAINSASLTGNVVNNAILDFVQETDGTFSGAISGTGNLVKEGAGALSLTGSLTYTGTTTILDGKLIGNISNLPGAIEGNGTMVIDQATDGVLYRPIVSTGSIEKQGAGKVTLIGANNVAGGTIVDGGTVEVGDLDHPDTNLSGDVHVDQGGTLSGHGSVLGDLTALFGGTVTPGGSIGTLKVAGNYNARPGSTLAIEVSPNAASKLVVGGSASLAGTLLLMFDPGVYTPQRYPVLTAANGVSGTFTTVTTTGSAPVSLSPSVSYGTNEVDVALANEAEIALAKIVLPANETILGTEDANVTLARIIVPTNDTVFPALTTVLVNNARRAALSLFDHSGAGQPVAMQGPAALANSLSGSRLDAAAAAAAMADVKRDQGVWFRGSGNFLSINGSNAAPGFTARTGGFETGYDHPVLENGRAGLALGYDRAEIGEHTGSSGSADTLRFALYGGVPIGPYRLDAMLGYDHDWQRSTRPIFTLAPASESRQADQADAAVQFSRDIPVSTFTFQPKAGFLYQHLAQGSFAESGGSGFALSGMSNSLNHFEPFVAVDAAGSFHSGENGEWRPSLGLRYSRTFGCISRTEAITTQSGAAFRADGIQLSRDRVDLSAGLTFLSGSNYTFAATYLATVPTGNLMEQDIELTLRILL